MHSKYSYEDSPSHLNRTPLSAKAKALRGDQSATSGQRGLCYLSKKTRQGLMAFSVAVLIFALLAWYYVTQHGRMSPVTVESLTFDPRGRLVLLARPDGRPAFKAQVGLNVPEGAKILDCAGSGDGGEGEAEAMINPLCLSWISVGLRDESPLAQLRLGHSAHSEGVRCVRVEWTAFRLNFAPLDCVLLNGSAWYGGSEAHAQRWPLDGVSLAMQPYVSSDIVTDKDAFGSVLERYWLSSEGVAVIVDEDTPLHVSVNAREARHKLCLKAEYFNSPFQNPTNEHASLKYTVCMGQNARTVHEYVLQNYFARPARFPDERMLRYPIWSTWARYKVNVNQSAVLSYADEITRYGFSSTCEAATTCGQIEIDDKYTTHYGDADFDRAKFPDPRGMVDALHSKGFRVTAWTHPFANIDSRAFREGIAGNYWMRESSGRVPALVQWWNGIGAVLDVTSEPAASWYVRRLEQLRKDYGLDSFKFDAGEVAYLPYLFNATSPLPDPNLYCTRYVDLVASAFNRQIEVRCGHQSQHQPVFVRMMDKDSNWSYNNGLLTVIPSALLMGLLGYPFVLPDMIGGNAYAEGDFHAIYQPERELFVRWTQLTAYLPAMQFSVAPWQYDDEVVAIAREMVRVHEEVVTPKILSLTGEVLSKGYPIIRPLWWIAPTDKEAQRIDSEFLIGDDFLVAPVLSKNATKRDVYLPAGRWKEGLREQKILEGGRWLRDYPVLLSEVATFQKASAP